jgi:hypothetical protein
MENWFADDNLKSLKDARELHEKVASAYFDKLYEEQAKYQNKSGEGWGKYVKAFTAGVTMMTFGDVAGATAMAADAIFSGQYIKNTVKAMENLRIETRKASKGFLGTGLGGHSQQTSDPATWAREQGLGELFDSQGMVNKEPAERILDKYNDKLVGETEATLEALIDLKEQYDEYLEHLQEYVSDLYAPLVDNMVDSLWDWFDEGKNALDGFRDYAADTFRDIVSDMMRTIVLRDVVGTFQDDITALYKQFAEGKITEEQLMPKVAGLTAKPANDYGTQLPVLQELLNTVGNGFDLAGFDLKQAEENVRQGSKGLAASMTQDQATEMNAFLNNGIIFRRDIANNTGLIPANLTDQHTNNSAELMKNYAQNMLTHPANIDGNTGRLEAIERDISGISTGIDRITSWGVKAR